MKKLLSSFWIGFGSVMNLAGNYYPIKINSDEEAFEIDRKTIESDWNFLKTYKYERKS